MLLFYFIFIHYYYFYYIIYYIITLRGVQEMILNGHVSVDETPFIRSTADSDE